ncbi:MAG: efflux RND transporter periplasmic adaptor subunit [Myxococcota bacterium]
MKKVLVAAVVLALALTGAIVWRIRAQEAAEAGPASGSGIIEGEGVDLSARLNARITRIAVEEGHAIEGGAVLLELDCDEPEARLAEASARFESAQAQAEAAQQQAEAAARNSQAARVSVSANRAQLNALTAQRDVATREAERLEAMGDHASLSRRDQARSSATGLEAQARAARASRSASARQAAAARSQAEAALSQAESVVRQAAALAAVVRSAELSVEECRIVAPRSGIVERIYYEPGELVVPGAVVARILDSTFVRATFYLPNAEVDEASVGDAATVEADAYPGQSFSSEVYRIAREAEFTPRNIQTRTDRDRLVFPVEVRIANEAGSLRPGMPVTVTLGGRSSP